LSNYFEMSKVSILMVTQNHFFANVCHLSATDILSFANAVAFIRPFKTSFFREKKSTSKDFGAF
jgi:hypothetical protein